MRAALLAALAVCAAEGTAPSTATVHYMSEYRSNVYSNYSTPQEWVFPCTPGTLSVIVVFNTPSGYNLTVGGELLDDITNYPCLSYENVSVLYTPYDGDNHTVSFQWRPKESTPNPVAVNYLSDHGSIDGNFSTPHKWTIYCTPGTTISMDIVCPRGTIKVHGVRYGTTHDVRMRCPSDGEIRLDFYYYGHGDSYLTWSRPLDLSWSVVPTPAPAPMTVQHMPDHGSIDSRIFGPHEWVIFCTPGSTLWWDTKPSSTRKGYSLELDRSAYFPSEKACPSSGNMSVVYRPEEEDGRDLKVTWFVATAAPTWSPDTPSPPTPSPVVVHSMTDQGWVYNSYSTPQEWLISCTPRSTLLVHIRDVPSGYSLKGDSSPQFAGSQRVICPSSEKISLLYTPHDGDSHYLVFRWSAVVPAPGTAKLHYMSEEDSVSSSYSTPQEWVISCTSDSSLSVTVSELAWTLTTDTMSLHRGQWDVPCPTAGSIKLSYIPPPGSSDPLSVRWAPESSGGDGSQGNSTPLLIALIATAGVLVLVCVAVAVYCGRRGKAAEPNVYSFAKPCDGYGDVGHTGGFGGLHDTSSSPPGQQTVSEMAEKFLPQEGRL